MKQFKKERGEEVKTKTTYYNEREKESEMEKKEQDKQVSI